MIPCLANGNGMENIGKKTFYDLKIKKSFHFSYMSCEVHWLIMCGKLFIESPSMMHTPQCQLEYQNYKKRLIPLF